MVQLKSKTRESNIELYRIILMLLIIGHHYVVNSGLMGIMYQNLSDIKSIVLFILGGWGKIGINCFVLITGYYMCQSNISLKKFLKIIFEVEFYNILIYILFVLFGYENFQIKIALKCILPIFQISNDFVSCYIIFYLLIPFVNVLIDNLNEKQYIALLSVLLFSFTFLGNIPLIVVSINYVVWFIVIYLIGGYIRLYTKKIFNNPKLNICLCLICIFVDIISILFGIWISKKVKNDYIYYFVMDTNKILAVITSISIFLTFKNIKIKYNYIINMFAESTFGVLLIHANSDIMRNFLWKTLLKNTKIYYSELYKILGHFFASVLGIYLICVLIDQFRIRVLEKNIFNLLDNKIQICDLKLKELFKSKKKIGEKYE